MRTVTAILIGLSFILLTGRPCSAIDEKARLFDKLSNANWEEAMARMDAYAIQLQNEPNSIGVIIVYGGQQGMRGEAQAWGKCFKDYMINRRGLDAGRIVLLDGGYRESPTVEMWLSGGKAYMPTPSPTVDAKKVKFRKGKVKNWRSLCNI